MKKLVISLKQMITVSINSNFGLESNCESLKLTTHQLLGLAKTYLFDKNSNNQSSLSKIENAAANLASEIRAILFQAQKKTISTNISISQTNLSNSRRFSNAEPPKGTSPVNSPSVNKERKQSIDIEPKELPRTSPVKTPPPEKKEFPNNRISSTTRTSESKRVSRMYQTKKIHLTIKDREKLKETSNQVVDILSKHLKNLGNEWNNKQEKEKSGIIEEMTNRIEETIKDIHESQARTAIDLVGSSRDNAAKQNLNSLFNADSLDDWQEMLAGSKMTGVKISFETTGGTGSLQELYNELYNRTLQLIIHANHAVLSEKTTEENVSEKVKQLYETCIKVLSVIGENGSISSSNVISGLIYSALENLRSADVSSPPNEYIVLDAQGQLAQLIYSGLLKQLYTASDSVRVIFLHLLTTLKQIVEDQNHPITETSALQIVASIKTIIEVVNQLLTGNIFFFFTFLHFPIC